MAGSCEYGNENLDPTEQLLASQKGFRYMELVKGRATVYEAG